MYMYIHRVHVHTSCTCIYMYTKSCTCVYIMYMYIHTCIHVHVYTYTCIHVYVYTCTCIHVHVYTSYIVHVHVCLSTLSFFYAMCVCVCVCVCVKDTHAGPEGDDGQGALWELPTGKAASVSATPAATSSPGLRGGEQHLKAGTNSYLPYACNHWSVADSKYARNVAFFNQLLLCWDSTYM